MLYSFGLENHLQGWIQDGSSPDKLAWKKIVRTSVSSQHNLQRQDRLSSDSFFSTIFGNTEPSSWKLPKKCYKINLCKFICKFENLTKHVCLLCQKLFFTNLFAHASCVCLATVSIRDGGTTL